VAAVVSKRTLASHRHANSAILRTLCMGSLNSCVEAPAGC
jgi:hypothetical protein